MTHAYDPAEQARVEQARATNQYVDRVVSPPSANSTSAVSWGAIFAGAVAAAALSMLLLMLGTGLGLSSVSPWDNKGISAEAFGIATIGWLMFTQIAASGMGGYLAGRLRTKWIDTHVDEVYFRDTAHGFLTWCVAAVISAMLFSSAVGYVVGGGAKAIGAVAGGAAAVSAGGVMGMADSDNGMSGKSMGYFVNSLFRTTGNATAANGAAATQPAIPQDPTLTPSQMGQVTGIFANALSTGSLPAEDKSYVAQLISQKTGISQQQAEMRVQNGLTQAQAKIEQAKTEAKKAADDARKVTSSITLWTFVSLLIGAFVASLCATFGGRQRDL